MAGNDSYTKLLLHMDGDVSSYNHNLIENQTIGYSNTVKKFGKSSIHFDGLTDHYLYAPDDNSFDFVNNGEWTIEFWVNTTTKSTNVIGRNVGPGNYEGWYFWIGGAGQMYFYGYNGAVYNAAILEATTDVTDGDWHHVAYVHKTGTARLYIDGIQEDERTNYNVSNNTNAPFVIGSYHTGSAGRYTGYLDEIRISKDIARWWDTFTPPTEPYTADSNTVFLYHCEGDSSIVNKSMKFWRIDMRSDIAKWAHSYYFNTSTVTVPDSDDFYFGTGNFTIDFWMYPTAENDRMIFGQGSGDNSLSLYLSAGKIYLRYNDTEMYVYTDTTTRAYELNEWSHVAVVRHGTGAGELDIYVNGVEQVLHGNIAANQNIPNFANDMVIGYGPYYNYYAGYLDEFRISKGTARWTSNFDVPTSPYTQEIHSIQGTSSESLRVIVLDQSDWSVEATEIVDGDYSVETTEGAKTVIGRKNDGQALSYGGITPTTEEV